MSGIQISNNMEAMENISRGYPGWWEEELKESWGTLRDSQHCPQQFGLFELTLVNKRFEHLLQEREQMWFSGASEKLSINQTRKVQFAYPLPAEKWSQNEAQRTSRELINRPVWRKRKKQSPLCHSWKVSAVALLPLGQCHSLQLHPCTALCFKTPQHKTHSLKWV